jgi:hypothetical protein
MQSFSSNGQSLTNTSASVQSENALGLMAANLMNQNELVRPPFDQLLPFEGLALDCEADFAAFNAKMQQTGLRQQLAAQTPALLADGLSYEQRIAERGVIATRAGSLHDFFSALMWLRFPRVKQAINQLQMRGIAAHGVKVRSRHQQAITHLDEAGAWIACSEPELLNCIDQHQWQQLFFTRAAAWGQQIEARIFGHAIFELLQKPHQLIAAKVIWVQVPQAFFGLPASLRDDLLDQIVAPALLDGRASADPKLLSTVPLSGIPGWMDQQDAAFYQSAPCFRPKPPGRQYGQSLILPATAFSEIPA